MSLVLPLLAILALIVGIIAMAMSIYNYFRMSQEVRSNAGWWINLVPYIAFAFPSALTPSGATYRSRGTSWLLVAGASASVVVGARFIADR
jgi:uncharacterized membrane protein YkvI